jgi:poly-gamma-glutamate synthesis protein (capsule biosynthesis protein)
MKNFILISALLTSIVISGTIIFVANEKKATADIYKNLQKTQPTSVLSSPPLAKHVFSLLFVGDVMLDRGVKNTVERKLDGDYLKLFDLIKLKMAKSDISILNLEGPVSNRGYDLQNLYSFRMDTDALHTLRNAGFNFISFTNNHVGDWGREAFDDTLIRAEKEDFKIVGAGKNYSEIIEPVVWERNNIRVGFLGFSDVGPEYMKAGTSTSGILLLSDPNLETIIKNAKTKVDQLVVSVHWGEEYMQNPNQRQIDIGRKLIDWGATLVVGHHPHVMQTEEQYKDGLIIYSLGNFIFDQNFSKETMEGGVLEVVFSKDAIKSYKINKIQLDKNYIPSFTEVE